MNLVFNPSVYGNHLALLIYITSSDLDLRVTRSAESKIWLVHLVQYSQLINVKLGMLVTQFDLNILIPLSLKIVCVCVCVR